MITQEITKTITLTSDGSATAYNSTHLSGLVHDIYVSISAAAGAGDTITISTTDAAINYFVLANPSTVGGVYYPRIGAVDSTGAAVPSSAVYVPRSIYKERVKIVAACSSGLADETVTVRLRISN